MFCGAIAMNLKLAPVIVLCLLRLFLFSDLELEIAKPLLSNEVSNSTQKLDVSILPKSIQVIGDRLVLSNKLQKCLKPEIVKAQKKSALLNPGADTTGEGAIGLIYFHEGRNYWSLEFIYDGFALELSSPIILTSQQIDVLEDAFKQTRWVRVKNKIYPTTGSLRRLGPILHSLTPTPESSKA